jgi:hypothetical protein
MKSCEFIIILNPLLAQPTNLRWGFGMRESAVVLGLGLAGSIRGIMN